MKQRIHFFSCVAFAAAWLAWPMMTLGQTPEGGKPVAEKPVAASAASSPSPIPTVLSVEVRALYELQMKTLRAQIDAAKWPDALVTAETMNKERPREPQARFLKTIALTELGRGSEAERELQALVADYPELPEPHNNLATLYAKRGEYELARRELELALIAVPDYEMAHANLADLQLQQAIEHYRRAAALAKNSKEKRAMQARADAVQTLLVAETKSAQADKTAEVAKNADAVKSTDAAKGDDVAKSAVKNEKDAAKKDDFLSGGCDAPPGFGGKDGDDVFSSNGTCEIDFDEPPPEKKDGGGEKEGKAKKP
ncbi:MAG: hypothetical protein LBB65_03860 [Burkholderiales bacterium]|nr:hypothetical protein [Burkholderiales bacterium]